MEKRDTFHASAPREAATNASIVKKRATSPVTAPQRGKCLVTTAMVKGTCRENAPKEDEEVEEVCKIKTFIFFLGSFYLILV